MEKHMAIEHGHSDDDSFEDAQELHPPRNAAVPTTRVEKTDDEPSHGEVPGTEAYDMRTADAVPDQLEVVPEGSRSRSSSQSGTSPTRSAAVPKMVVEKVDPSSPSHGEVPGTEAHAMRQADAEPDEVLRAPEIARAPITGTPTNSVPRSEANDFQATIADIESYDEPIAGDDFDDFEEGGGDDDDFGDFDEGEQTHEEQRPPPPVQHKVDLVNFDATEDIHTACQPFIDQLFPKAQSQREADVPPVSNSFLNERSHSLWSQLVAPPALQPPNWVRSRTRRLFLVSLGVPVDLDEILPASKQKKLVLPSIDLELERSASNRDGTIANGTVARLKQQNSSSSSVNKSSSKPERRRKGPPPPPAFDENDARLAAQTTSEAMSGFSDEELVAHKQKLEELKKIASESLEYWLIQRDSANGDKEAFEEVIQNLVKHAQKIRT